MLPQLVVAGRVLPVCTTRVSTPLLAAALACPLPTGDAVVSGAGVPAGLVSVGLGDDPVVSEAVGVGVVGLGEGVVGVGDAEPGEEPVGAGVGVGVQLVLGVPRAAFGPALPVCPAVLAEAAGLPAGATAPGGLPDEPGWWPWRLTEPALLIWVVLPGLATLTA